MTKADTRMRREILEIPEAAARLLDRGGDAVARAGAALHYADPALLVTVARGSSDHVATFLKYATELLAGRPVASLGPSVASVYGRSLRLDGAGCVAISQSGQSPDIVAMARMAREAEALGIAITNDPASPLAAECAHPLDIHAGPELSVAATKTFVNSAICALWLLAEWVGDDDLRAALRGLPPLLEKAVALDWEAPREATAANGSLYCLGRGPAYALACEAALKFKETCQLHAEAYSSAEVLHGPVSIVERGFPVIALCAADAAEGPLVEVADAMAGKGAQVFVTSESAQSAQALPVIRTGHPLTDPIALIASFYAMVERVAVARGIDPDAPRHLRKVTETR